MNCGVAARRCHRAFYKMLRSALTRDSEKSVRKKRYLNRVLEEKKDIKKASD
jgi:hypothetical protein